VALRSKPEQTAQVSTLASAAAFRGRTLLSGSRAPATLRTSSPTGSLQVISSGSSARKKKAPVVIGVNRGYPLERRLYVLSISDITETIIEKFQHGREMVSFSLNLFL